VVAVTGSSGLIGEPLCRRLAERYTVIGFDRVGPPHPPPVAEQVPVDLTSDESVHHAVGEVRRRHGRRLAALVHLAAYYDFSGEPSPLYEQVTVRGTGRLIEALRAQQVAVEQFVFSSTMLVHAPCEPGERITEDWPVDPRWDYPRSKVETERLITAERGARPSLMLRIAGVYTDRCRSIPLAQQVRRLWERRLTARVFPGDVSHGQAFVHLDDTVEALALAVEHRHLAGATPVLIGEPETLSYDELQRAFARLLLGEEGWETREIPELLAKSGAWVLDNMPLAEEPFIKPWMIDLADDHYAIDPARARALLGWTPKRSLRDTLPLMAAALRDDPAGWYQEHEL
jgi:nucleoside-diphosphate-sugar epimerase